MSRFTVGNLFLLVSMLANVGSQFVIKKLLNEMRGDVGQSLLQQLMVPERLVRAGAGMLLLVIGYLAWVLALARLNLAYAFPVASASVLFVTFFSAVYLGETVTARMWLGTVLVLVGVVLLGPSS